MPMCWAWERAPLTANPSAMIADGTVCWYWHLSKANRGDEESKIQASPAADDSFFQAASVLHVTTSGGIDRGRTGIWVVLDRGVRGSWACIHSLASIKAFEVVAMADADVFQTEVCFWWSIWPNTPRRRDHSKYRTAVDTSKRLLLPLHQRRLGTDLVWNRRQGESSPKPVKQRRSGERCVLLFRAGHSGYMKCSATFLFFGDYLVLVEPFVSTSKGRIVVWEE